MSQLPCRSSVISWALYDLANTIFSMNIVSLYFSLWVVNEMGGSDADYGNANALSMSAMFLTAPLLGALSDQARRRIPFLVATTLLCVAFTAMLGSGGLMSSVIFFILANYMFQAGLVFYDSLLPEVSTEENRGRIGGLGIGLGYVGSFIGVGCGVLLLERIGYVGIFRLSAALFFIFALPCFLFVKERRREARPRSTKAIIAGAFSQVRTSLAHARSFPDLWRFLTSHVFYADAVNTIIIFMGIYVTNEVGFTSGQAQVVLLLAITAAAIGGFLWGPIVDRLGPKRTLNIVLALWMFVLALAALIGALRLAPSLFWPVACLAGISLGGTWASDRPLMLRLTPPQYLGEFYGLYSMVGRFASVIGPLVWGLIVDRLELGRPVAILSLLLFVIVAFVILQKVDDRPRNWDEKDFSTPPT